MDKDYNKTDRRKFLIVFLLFISLTAICSTVWALFCRGAEQIPAPNHKNYAETISNDSTESSQNEENSGTVVDSLPDYIREEAERIAKVVRSRQNANTITFLACSDIHYYSPNNVVPNVNAEKMKEAVVSMGLAMELIREQVDIDFAVMFGDMTWDYGETRDEQLEEMRFVNDCLYNGFQSIPQFRIEGNHDDAYGTGNALTSAEIFENIGIWNDGAVYGDRAAGYCYRDFEKVKLRVICLNSSQYSGGSFLMDSEQVEWLKMTLDLSNKDADWRSIILSHHPLDWGKAGGENPTEVINSATGLIASFHGHIHNFLTGTVTNTKLPRISIPNAGYSRENQYDEAYGINWKEGTTYAKIPGTAENTSFCVVTIDLAEEKIYADHYGAGYGRIISYGDMELTDFTVNNQLANVNNSNPSSSVKEGSGYDATLKASQGYKLKSVTVTMDGDAVAVNSGMIHIPTVTGDIVITAVAEKSSSSTNYTNLVPSATAAINGTEIYNGNGYRNGAYVSDGGTFGSDPDCVAVGYLKLNAGDVIYISGADLAKQNHVRLYMQSQNGNAYRYFLNPMINDGQWADSAGNVGITIEKLGDMYYKLTPISGLIGSETVYYRMSLYGAGENLVITHNEPIE